MGYAIALPNLRVGVSGFFLVFLFVRARFVIESGQDRMAINKTQGKPPAADLPASLGQKKQVPSSVPRLAGVPPGGLSDPLQWFCVPVGGLAASGGG